MKGFSVLVNLIEQVQAAKNLLKENLVGVNFEAEGKVKLFYDDKKMVTIDMKKAKKKVDKNNEEHLIANMRSGCVVKNYVEDTQKIPTSFREIEYLKNVSDYTYSIDKNTNCFRIHIMKDYFATLKSDKKDDEVEQRIKNIENSLNHNEKLVCKFDDMIKDPDKFNLIADIKECIKNNGSKDQLEKIVDSLSSDDRFFVYNLITHCKILPAQKKAIVIFDEIEKEGLNIKEKVNKDEIVELMQKNSNVYLLKHLTPTVEVKLNKNIKNAMDKKEAAYIYYLDHNYLILEGAHNASYDTIKELYDAEKETKLFSSASDRNEEYLGTKIEIFNAKGSKGGTVLSTGDVGDPIYIGVGERKSDSVISVDAQQPLGIKNSQVIINHELQHFKLALIAEKIAKSMKQTNYYNEYIVINNQIKKYMQEEGIKRYNAALKLLGIDEVEKTKVYYKYDLEDELSELLLLGHSGYSKNEVLDYVADTGIANDFQGEALKDLYKEVFNNDFRNLNEKQAIEFIKKIGFKDTNEIFNKTSKVLNKSNKAEKVNNIINDSNNLWVNNLIEMVKHGVTTDKYLAVNDEKTNIKRYLKYKLLCDSIIIIAIKYGGLSEGTISNSEMQTYLKDEIKKQYQNIDWSKIASVFNKKEVNEIKKYVKGVQNIYSERISNNSTLINSINTVKESFIDKKIDEASLPIGFFVKMFNQSAEMRKNIKNRYYDMIKNQKYRLMKKFVKKEPHFNKLFSRLNDAIPKGETNFKNILKDELKDVYDAHLFFNAMKKDLSKYDNPFEKIKNKEEQKSKYTLLCENQQTLNKMIDEINVVEDDIKNAQSRLENKSFFELVKAMKKEEMDAKELSLQNEKKKLLEELKKDVTIGKYFDKLSQKTKKYIESYINNQYLGLSTFEKYALERIKKEVTELSKKDNASKKQKMDLKTLANEKKKVNVQKKVEKNKILTKKVNPVKKKEPPVSAYARRKEYAKNAFGQNNKVIKRT